MYGPSFDQPPQKVFQLEPRAGRPLPDNAVLLVYAYQNPQFRQQRWHQTVPSVAGLPLEEAEARLRKQGFETVLAPVPTDLPEMNDVVRAQSLRPRSMAWPTAQVHLQVNRLVKASPASPPDRPDAAVEPAPPPQGDGAPAPRPKGRRPRG
jgi:hypothetical protein